MNVNENAVQENNFDPNTGQPINNNVVGNTNHNRNNSNNKKGLAIASMVLGILGILGSWIPYLNIGSMVMALVGIGLGIPALVIYVKTKKSSLGMAISGIILSVLTLIISIVMNVVVTNAIYDEIEEGTDSWLDDYFYDDDVTETKNYGIGDLATFTTDEGTHTIKITNVYETANRNSYSATVADKVVIIEYEYENIDMSEDLYISFYDAYDSDGLKLDSYPASEIVYGGSISTGRKAVASEAFAVNNSNNYIELEYYADFWDVAPDAIFQLDW